MSAPPKSILQREFVYTPARDMAPDYLARKFAKIKADLARRDQAGMARVAQLRKARMK